MRYYRYVRDADDGCGVLECTACKGAWEWRCGSRPVRFCMFCGIEFIGEWQCRSHDEPRWRYDFRNRVGEEAFYKWSNGRITQSFNKPRKRSYWVLEARLVDNDDDHVIQIWNVDSKLTWLRTAREAFEYLKERRAENEDDGKFGCRTEYRMLRRTDEC